MMSSNRPDATLPVQLICSENPHIPRILLGHSMGSFAAQQYLHDRSTEVDAVILTGTTALDLLESTIDPDQSAKLSVLNATFQPARTDFDWLSRDETVVDAYIVKDIMVWLENVIFQANTSSKFNI